jgi:hypothetical protein
MGEAAPPRVGQRGPLHDDDLESEHGGRKVPSGGDGGRAFGARQGFPTPIHDEARQRHSSELSVTRISTIAPPAMRSSAEGRDALNDSETRWNEFVIAS